MSPAVGNPHDASDFFIFSRAELGQFAETDCNGSNDKQVDVSGSNNEYHGRIHSHADLAVSGTGNRFSAELTYGTHDEDCQLQAEPQSPGGYLAGQPTEVDELPSGLDKYGWPGGLGSYLDSASLDGTPSHRTAFSSVGQALPGESCDIGTLTGTGVLTITQANHGQVVCNGTGKVQLNASGVSAEQPLEMSITILSHGAIEISGQNLRLSPAVHRVLAMTDQPGSENDVSIKLSGSNLDVPKPAILFTPRSGQDVSGSDGSEMCVQLIGQGRIKAAGSNSLFGPHLCHPPLPDVTAPPAPARTYTIDYTFPGVSVTVRTNGGIWPSDVAILPAREYMSGRMAASFAGPAFDIDVPESAPPIQGATLTLPYHEHRLGGASESEVRIYTFDEDSQFWLKVPGEQTVDAASNTVTASVDHLSVYAVLKGRTAADWAQIFGNTPVRCVGGDPGANVGIDVAFLVDSSGSMGGNDPLGKRVEAAKRFVDAMRPNQDSPSVVDRAAVVDFDSTARRLIDLTGLDTDAGRNAVKAALDQTNNASGGTNISAAVQQAIAILSANGGGGRLRVAVLLTDGQSSYNTALTQQAAEQAIEIHTVGLGGGVNAALLQQIARDTGGSYRFLNDPNELPALFEDLAGDIIGGDTDTDGDTLTDCVEENGMFVPISLVFPVGPTPPDFPSFVTTDPNAADTDGDTLPDSGPGGELEQKSLLENESLAEQYSFLIDAGLTHYYLMHSDPNKPDTDGDGLRDDLEAANGTNPFIPDENDLGIEGLDLPPFTLFQPSRYDSKPAIEEAVTIQLDGTTHPTTFNDSPVVYDDDRNCVENCAAIADLAAARPDVWPWDLCYFDPFGICSNDASQARDIVEEARVRQQIFDADGLLNHDFLAYHLVVQCAQWYSDAGACADAGDRVNFNERDAELFVPLIAAATVDIPADVPRVPNRETLQKAAGQLVTAGAVIAAGFLAAEIVSALQECWEGPALRLVGQTRLFEHPCVRMPVYSPGGDVPEAAQHREDAIQLTPTFVRQKWATPGERNARGVSRDWYIGKPGCTPDDKQQAQDRFGGVIHCDEFPNWAMFAGGPPSATNGFVMPSLKYIPGPQDNAPEGNRFGRFATSVTQGCPGVSGTPRLSGVRRREFLVAPIPEADRTVWHCGLP